MGGIKSFRPPHTQFLGGIKKFLDPHMHILKIWGGIKFLDPPHTLTIFGGYKRNVDFLCKCSCNKKKTVNISWNLPVSAFRVPHTQTKFGGGYKK